MVNVLETENEVKKALNIDSFRNLSKRKVVEFVSLLPQMDKEVATAIINQFPNYSQTVSEMVKQLGDTCNSILEKNDTSTRSVVEAYQKILDDLRLLLQRDDLSFDERQQITSSMIEVADKLAEKDTENKHFLSTIAKYAVGTVLSLALIMAMTLGVKSKSVDLPKIKS